LAWRRRCGLQGLLETHGLEIDGDGAIRGGGEDARIWEEALAVAADDDGLVASKEEAVWVGAAVGWMGSAAGGTRGRGVAGRIRFPLAC
jgi:hypothetical protein